MNLDTLREAFTADVTLRSNGGHCPDAERIWQSATEEAPGRRDDELLLHVGECGSCAAAWRVAREMAGDRAPVNAAGPARSSWRSARLRWGAAAAMIVAALALGVLFTGPWKTEPPAYRAQETFQLLPAGEDGETLPRDTFVLRWTAGPGGSTYDVRVTNEKLDLLAQGRRLENSRFTVPPGALEELPSGARVFWQVTAHLPDGRRLDSDSFLVLVE